MKLSFLQNNQSGSTVIHPILNKLWKTAIYIFLWAVVGFFYFRYLSKNYPDSSDLHLFEIIINLLFVSTLNLGLWYFLRYTRLEDNSNIRLILNHVLVSVLLTLAWIFLGWLIMFFISQDKNIYNSLFLNTLYIKIILGIVFYFFTIFFYYLVIYYQNYKENVIRKNELALLLQQQELNNLREQINPHFLFNSLNSISYLIYSSPDDAHNSIVKLSEYFRYSLKISKTQLTTVKDEIENINRYFDIEKIRFSNKMEIKYDIDNNCNEFQIPVMLLQPIAENAIKHGVYENTEKTFIDISIKDNNDFYTINLKNTYDPEATPRKGTGTGITNVKNRLKLIYKRNDLMTVKKSENIFEVKIIIPKKIEL